MGGRGGGDGGGGKAGWDYLKKKKGISERKPPFDRNRRIFNGGSDFIQVVRGY